MGQIREEVPNGVFAPYTGIKTNLLFFTKGEPTEFRSSAPVVRTFCATCGTPLTYRHDKQPDTLDITTCSLDAPERFPPTHHSWLSHDLAWVKFGDGLPTFQEFRPQP